MCMVQESGASRMRVLGQREAWASGRSFVHFHKRKKVRPAPRVEMLCRRGLKLLTKIIQFGHNSSYFLFSCSVSEPGTCAFVSHPYRAGCCVSPCSWRGRMPWLVISPKRFGFVTFHPHNLDLLYPCFLPKQGVAGLRSLSTAHKVEVNDAKKLAVCVWKTVKAH